MVRLPRRWRATTLVAAAFSYLVVATGTHIDEHLSYSPYNTLMALVCALVLALVVLPASVQARRPALLRLLETRPVIGIGVISSSVFVWHEPLVRWLHDRGLALGGFFVNTLLLAVVTLLLSALTYRYVEALALRLKVGPFARRPAEPSAQVQAAP